MSQILVINRVRVLGIFLVVHHWGQMEPTKFVQAEVELNCFCCRARGLGGCEFTLQSFYTGRLCLYLQPHTFCIPFLTEQVHPLVLLNFENGGPYNYPLNFLVTKKHQINQVFLYSVHVHSGLQWQISYPFIYVNL